MAAADFYNLTQELYISYFGRPADPRGLEAFAQALSDANAPTDIVELNAAYKTNAGLKALVDSFGTSTESATLYSSVDVDTFVNSIFLNVLGRAPKLAGLNYWNAEISSGRVTRAGAALSIMAGAFANTTDPVQAAIDQAVVLNKVAVAANFTASIDNVDELIAYKGAAAAGTAREMLHTVDQNTNVTTFQTTVTATIAALVNTVLDATGKIIPLTIQTDTVLGTAGNDTITASYDIVTGNHQLSGLDSINGGAGTDTLAITNSNGNFTLASAINLSNVEKITIASVGSVSADINVASITGVSSLSVTQATDVTLTAGATTDMMVSGATGTVSVNGGKIVGVTAATANQIVQVGGGATASGAVTVNHTNQGHAAIEIDGGNGVTVTAAGATTGTIDIGQTIGGAKVASDAAKGAVLVSTVGADYASAAVTRGAITIDGGSTVTVTEAATSSGAAAAANGANIGNEITQGAVTVNGTADTTAVTVTESAASAGVNAIVGAAGANETQTVTFVAMAAGEQITVDGLTFTASKALTAAQAAAAFANVANGAVAGSAPAANGIYSGAFGTIGGSTGAVTTTSTASTVTFTSSSKADVAVVTVSDTAAAGDVAAATVTAGAGSTTAKTGVLGVIGGQVIVHGDISGTDVLTSVSLTGFGAGSTVASDALTSLNLSSSLKNVTITNNAATTLALGVNAIGSSATHGAVDTGATYTTVNIAATGASSVLDLTSSATTLSIGGDHAVDLSGSTLGNLATVTVTGSAGVTFDIDEADTITSFNAGGTSGSVTAFINGHTANYTGSTGVDTVTLTNTVVDKTINLGSGDDTLNLASGTTSLVSEVQGGTGTDTLGMAAADAATASATATFATKITSFEKLSLGAVASGASATVNLANLDDINYVVSANAVTAAEVQTFAVTSGTSAAVAKVETFTITSGSTTDATAVAIDGVSISITAGDSIDTIGAKIAAQEAAIITASGNLISSVGYNTANDTVTVTYTTGAQNTGSVAITDTNADVSFGSVAVATAYDSNAGNITVAGGTVALTAGMTVDQVGAAIAAAQGAIQTATPTVDTVTYDAATDTVSITYLASAGDVANAAIGNTSATGAAFGAVGATAGVGTLTLTNMANAGTLELTAGGSGAVVTMKDASGTADSFNVVTKVSTGNLTFGTVNVAGVETVHLTATDTSTSAINSAAVTLKDTALKSLVIDGNAHVSLTLDAGIVSLTSLNASALTGNLTAATNGTVAQTITGGSGADMLTGNGNGDILIGGAGNDTLVVMGNLATLTGGTGSDVFNVAHQTTNVNSYATITDLGAGDSIKFDTGATNFLNGKVTLADTAVFQDYANAAVNLTTGGNVAWFQLGGNTYVIENTSGSTSFVNGTDAIVKITGTVDLSTAAFSATTHSLIIV